MIKYAHVTYDWKQGGCEDEWAEALKVFNLHVTEDPTSEGSDQFGYFITNREPTQQEISWMVINEHGWADSDEEGS